jgi:hypothetical protein
MVHRDGSATYSPADLEGSYLTAKERDPNSNIPALTTEEIVAEAEAVKEQYREYLDRRGERDILARLFPMCVSFSLQIVYLLTRTSVATVAIASIRSSTMKMPMSSIRPSTRVILCTSQDTSRT